MKAKSLREYFSGKRKFSEFKKQHDAKQARKRRILKAKKRMRRHVSRS